MTFVKLFDNLVESINLFDMVSLFGIVRSLVNPVKQMFTLLLLLLSETQNRSGIKFETLKTFKINYLIIQKQ